MLGWSCSRYTIALRDHVPPHFLFIALNVNFTKKTSSYNFHFHWKCYNPKYWCFSKPRIVYIYNLKGNKKKKSKSNKLKKKTNKRKRKEKGKKGIFFPKVLSYSCWKIYLELYLSDGRENCYRSVRKTSHTTGERTLKT